MTRNRTTGIEWTEHTWNPFAGCTINSAGCTNCYAMAMARRLEEMGTTPTYVGLTKVVNGKAVWTGRVNKGTAAVMRKPFTVREPSIFFVNSMSDFWHPNARDEWRIEALGVMAATWHQYQVLTKLPQNIAPFLAKHDLWLPRNVWAGATVERHDFRHRIDQLREVDAAIRFLSVEPIIGRVGELDLSGIHWVIGGGESGPGAREMQPEWARALRDECLRQGVAFFWKQWGRPQNNPLYQAAIDFGSTPAEAAAYVEEQDPNGKGGSKIDGREWKQYPDFQPQKQMF
jgi:protein gp37